MTTAELKKLIQKKFDATYAEAIAIDEKLFAMDIEEKLKFRNSSIREMILEHLILLEAVETCKIGMSCR